MREGNKILITGSTHGIGKAAAEKFLRAGWEVYGCGSNRDDKRGPKMEMDYPLFHFQYADISVEEEVRTLFDWCSEVNAAFNNAGTGCAPAPAHRMDSGAARRILEVNLLGTALCMKYECARMLQKGGVIVNNSSVAAFRADTGADPVYAAAKAGILRLAAEAAVRPEYRGRIRFFTVIPGWIETRMTAVDDKSEWEKKLPGGRAGTPQEVAELVYRVITEQDCFDSGQEFHVNGGGILV